MTHLDATITQAIRDLGLDDTSWITMDEARDVLEEVYWQGYEARERYRQRHRAQRPEPLDSIGT